MDPNLNTREDAVAPLWLGAALGGLAALTLTVGAVLVTASSRIGSKAPSQRPKPPRDIARLSHWLATQESKFSDIKPFNEKAIVWADKPGERTTWSVVYLHGFSGSRLETAPLTELVGRALGANVFNSRLTGHGRGTQALCEARAQDWMADATEALQIGKILGEKVLLISCSTGSTLATWLALSPKGRDVTAHVFISPNFGLKDKRGELVYSLWNKSLAFALKSARLGWTPRFPEEANAWTTPYPLRAILPMMALLRHVRRSDLTQFKKPVLVFYSEGDQTVDPKKTRWAFGQFSSRNKSLQTVHYSTAKGQHVLAGALRDPQAITPMVSDIVKWVKALPKAVNGYKRG